jgi:hypothetical protein
MQVGGLCVFGNASSTSTSALVHLSSPDFGERTGRRRIKEAISYGLSLVIRGLSFFRPHRQESRADLYLNC